MKKTGGGGRREKVGYESDEKVHVGEIREREDRNVSVESRAREIPAIPTLLCLKQRKKPFLLPVMLRSMGGGRGRGETGLHDQLTLLTSSSLPSR